MTTAAYAVRQLNYTFQLGQGDFGASGSTTLTLPAGLRSELQIVNALTPSTGTLVARIYGLTLDHMNQASKAGLVWAVRNNNYVTVWAGDSVSGMTTIYKGLIIEAYPDMEGQPSTPLFVTASPTIGLQTKPVAPVSFASGTPGSTALQSILKPAGVTLENNGVTGVLSTPYFPGTVWDQALSAVRALNCFAHYDAIANTLAIWPKDGARTGEPALISPATGLVGYPSFQSSQVRWRMLFDPGIQMAVGRRVNMQSGLTAADGLLTITGVTYDLSAQVDKGPWFMTITAIPVTAPAQ